jgi:hypothetical protein
MTISPPTPPSTPQSSTTPPPRKRRGRWWKILLGIFILILVLVLLLPTLLSTGAGTSFLLGKVNGRVPGKITAANVSVGWFSGTRLRNLEVKDPDGKPVISVSSLDTGATLMDLLTPSSIDLGNVVVRGLRANLITYPDGSTNLGRSLTLYASPPPTTRAATGPAAQPPEPIATVKPDQAPASRYLVKGTLDAQDCQLTWDGPDAPPLTVDNLSARSTFDTSGGTTDLDLTAQARSGNGAPAPISAKFSGQFFDNGALKPIGSLAGAGNATVKSLDLAALSPMLQTAGLKAALTGNAELTLTLSNANGREGLQIDIPITNLTATGEVTAGDTLRIAKAAFTLDAALTGDALDIQKFQLASDLVNASGKGLIKTNAGNAPPEPLTLNLMADVTALKRQLPKKLGSLPDTRASMSLTGRADTAAKTFAVTTDSAVNEKDETTGQGNTLILAAGSVISWGTAPSDIRATATYDLGRLQQLFSASLPEGTTLAGIRTMKLHASGPLAMDAAGLKKFSALSIERTLLGFDKITAKGFELGRADVPFEMKSGVLTLSPTAIPANGGSLHLRGRLDLTQEIPTFFADKTAAPEPLIENIAINHQIAAGALGFLPLVWGGEKSSDFAAVGGTLNVTLLDAAIPLDAVAIKSRGTLDGSLRIDNLSTSAPIFSQLFQQLGPVFKITQPDALAIRGGQIPETPFALKDGKITYQNLTIHSNDVDIVIGGAVGLDQSLAMNMTVKTKAANIAVPVGLKGTTTKPELAVSGDALKQTIQNVAPKVIEDLLNRNKK